MVQRAAEREKAEQAEYETKLERRSQKEENGSKAAGTEAETAHGRGSG